MTDSTLASYDKEKLQAYVSGCQNIIGPVRGVPQGVDEDGKVTPARGDADKWYVCVRLAFPVPVIDGIEEVSAAEGSAVLGVWA